MGFGDVLKNAWDGATDAAKSAAQTVSDSASAAYDATKQGVVDAATFTRDAAVAGYEATKDAAVAGYEATRDAAVAGYNMAKDTAIAGYNAAGEAINAAGEVIGEAIDDAKLGAIRAREAQARKAFGSMRDQLSNCEAGSPSEPCPHKIALCNELKDAQNKAILSNNTYLDGQEGIDDPALAGTGYSRLDPVADADEFQNQLGIGNPQEMLEPDGSDFRARVYKKTLPSGQTEYIVGYRGTQTGADWMQNLRQGSGFESDSYNRAKRLASIVDAKSVQTGNPVSFTGHSLGGGMASAAAAHTGRAASTFNAAGLNANTLGGAYPNPPAPVNAYFTPTDPLSALQDNRAGVLGGTTGAATMIPYVGKALGLGLGTWIGTNEVKGTPILPKAYGNRKLVPFPEGRAPPDLSMDGVLESHGMPLLIDSLEAERRALGCQ